MSQPSNPITNIFRWDGTVGRQTYAVVGILAFTIKNNLDRHVARYFLPNSRDFFFYWAPLGKAARLDHLSRPEINFLLVFLVLSIPFIWVGVAMTIRRLRDAAQPLWLVVLFFVPFVNLLFFAIMCLAPSSGAPMLNEATPWPHVRPLDQVIPHGKLASAMLSIAVTTVIRLLKFDVEENPAPLNELRPYKKISAPHLHGYLISHGGRFLLTPLPAGRTRLEGTTCYQHTMWPATYWGWWSNYVIHRIHMRVLNHIRERAEVESTANQAFAASAVSSTRR